MDSIVRWSLGIRTCIKSRVSTSNQTRRLHLPSVPLPVFPSALDPADASARESRNFVTRIKWDQLMDSLSRDTANPSRVWNAYLELGHVMGFEKLPLHIQQQVLRKSVPETGKLRYALPRRMQAGNKPTIPHLYESRLQTVIAHMREAGQRPELADYEFILEQFAAVGHQSGARMVFQELTQVVGVEPSFKTYGLCLQAIAHRLTLPCPYRYQRLMLVEASRMCTELLDDMWQRRIPLTSVNFDLVHRIFKETSDRVTFERLLRVGYGIDLAYPDRPILEMQGQGMLMDLTDIDDLKIFKPLPFSTAALNTLVDMLGRTKQVSRMVMAYEVLTNPLPTAGSTSSPAQWIDDEDDDPTYFQFASSDGSSRLHEFPSAIPNTTTFSLLIRYAAKAKHAVFARHYVVQAMIRDREVDALLRADLLSKPLKEVLSPNFAVNRGTFLPPYGLANRTKHFAFLRWGYGQAKLTLQRKREDLKFYTEWRQRHHKIVPNQDSEAVDNDAEYASPDMYQSDLSERPVDNLDTEFSSNTSSPTSDPRRTGSRVSAVPELPEALQVDLNAPPPPPAPIRKPFDIDRHIGILERDVQELGELVTRMEDGVRRLSQRIKERLGRRVWQGKDIYLMSRNERVYLTRREWMQRVGFVSPRRRAFDPSHNKSHQWQKGETSHTAIRQD